MRCHIRPYTPADLPAIERLLAELWGDDDGAAGYYAPGEGEREPETFQQTLVVVGVTGAILGFGNVGVDDEHPAHVQLSLNIAPAYQGRGVGRRLFAALVREAQTFPPRAWTTATYADQAAALAFLARRQFAEVMRTTILSLDVATFDPRPLAVHAAPLAAAGYRLAALPDLDAHLLLTEPIAALYCRHYNTAHPHSPPGLALWERRIEAFMGDDLIPAAQFVALHQGEPVAALGLRAGASPAIHDLIFAVDAEHHHAGRDLLLALLEAGVAWAKRAGVARLVVELDSVDPIAVALCAALPGHDGPAWLTLAAPADAVFPAIVD